MACDKRKGCGFRQKNRTNKGRCRQPELKPVVGEVVKAASRTYTHIDLSHLKK